MGDNNQDSGLAAGTEGAPTSEGSSQQGVQQSSVDASKLQSALEAMTKRLDEVDARSRSLQSEKDRGVTKTRKEVEELKRQVADFQRLKASGLEDEDAFEELSFREDIRVLRQALADQRSAPEKAAGNSGIGAAEAARLVAEYGLDPKDAEVSAVLNSGGDVDGKLAKVAFNRLKRPMPTQAQSAAMQGSPPPPPPADAQLAQEYQEKMLAARGNSTELSRIRDEYRQKGVPVEKVVFGTVPPPRK